MAGQELLTHAVSEFARTLARGSAISEVLNDLAERITAVLGVAAAGVSVLESGRFRFAAASDERSVVLERVQEAEQAGPGLEACLTGKVVTVASLPGTSQVWDVFQRAARAANIGAVASVPMCHDGESIGAVDLYSASRRDWCTGDLRAAGILADMATGYLVQAQELDRQCRVIGQLREALDSRIVIEQAKGVLAAERRISVDEAFEVLRRHARSHAVSLRSVAEAVVSLGLRP
jgi:transcriptional regulator with GAF, ATPase, and Fis domain